MKRFFRELVLLMLLLLCLGTVTYGNKIFAKNSNNNSIVLSQKYTGKKLDRVLSSIKTKNNYRFLIDSSDPLETIKDFFVAGDKKAKVKQVGIHTFMVRLPLNSTFLRDDLIQIDSGNLPQTIGGYDVIEPEIVEGFGLLNNPTLTLSLVQEISTGTTIKVGVLDSGIDYTHTDIANNYDSVLSYDFVNDDTDAMDDYGHGTQVSGLIKNSNLVGLKVLDANGLGTTYDVLEAIDYAKTNNIKVINLSFGGYGNPATNSVCQAITEAKNAGIYTVVSAGNTNQDVSNIIPAGCSDAIVVGASETVTSPQPSSLTSPQPSPQGEGVATIKASFSNYGTGVTVYAPGVNINTTTLNNAYTKVSGTSFSSAYVARLVSNELSTNPSITYSQVINDIKNNYGLVSSFDNSFSIDTGTGTTSSGATLSGSISEPQIDYSIYSYYSGTFLHDGKVYGNSLYGNSYNFTAEELAGIQVYSYSGYLDLQKNTKTDFSAMSIPTNGLVGRWDLNGNASDSSGNGNNGTAYNVGWVNSSGTNLVGNFNGTSYGQLANEAGQYPAYDFTLSSYINTNNTTTLGTIYNVDFSTSSVNVRDAGYRLSILADGRIYFTITTIGGLDTNFVSNNLFNDGKWHLVNLVRSGNKILFYIDGMLDSIHNYNSNPVDFYGEAYDNGFVGFGKVSRAGYDGDFFNGKLGLLRVYNRAITQSEINQLYQEGQE